MDNSFRIANVCFINLSSFKKSESGANWTLTLACSTAVFGYWMWCGFRTLMQSQTLRITGVGLDGHSPDLSSQSVYSKMPLSFLLLLLLLLLPGLSPTVSTRHIDSHHCIRVMSRMSRWVGTRVYHLPHVTSQVYFIHLESCVQTRIRVGSKSIVLRGTAYLPGPMDLFISVPNGCKLNNRCIDTQQFVPQCIWRTRSNAATT